jgi:hypothetical protein
MKRDAGVSLGALASTMHLQRSRLRQSKSPAHKISKIDKIAYNFVSGRWHYTSHHFVAFAVYRNIALVEH